MSIKIILKACAVVFFSTCFFSLSAQQQDIYITGDLALTPSNTERLGQVVATSTNVDKTMLVMMGNYHSDNNASVDAELMELKQLDKLTNDLHIISSDYRWRSTTSRKLKEIEDRIQDKLNEDVVLPDNACGEIETKNITDDIVMMIMDSEWFLQDWSDRSTLNEGCAIQSREAFLKLLAEEVYDNREKIILFFVHHPPRRFDVKGGHLNAARHLLPLPILGTLFAQSALYSKPFQSGVTPRYRSLAGTIEQLAEDHGRMFIISEDTKYSMIDHYEGGVYLNVHTSDKKAQFSKDYKGFVTNKPSILKLSIENDQIDIQFLPWDNQPSTEPLYSIRKSAVAYYDKPFIFDPNLKTIADSMSMPVFSDETLDIGADWLTGALNTDLYTQPIRAKVLDIEKRKLEADKLGGGKQTVSIKFEDANNNRMTARPLLKNPTKLLPKILRYDFTKSLLQYFFTSANPYAFLTIYPMERELDLFYTEPVLRYMPYHEDLGIYNRDVSNKLVQYSNRDRGLHSSRPASEDLEDTEDIKEDYKKGEVTFEKGMYQRARMLDILINDWDRHVGQWKWIPIDTDQEVRKVYAPIARDRDQAYSNLDGAGIRFIRSMSPELFGLQPFTGKFGKKAVKWKYKYAAPMDQMILNDVSKLEWDSEVALFKKSLTAEVIDAATNKFPTSLNPKVKLNTASILKERMTQIDEAGENYYELINKEPLVRATSEPDKVKIEIGNNEISVHIQTEVDDKIITHYDHVFSEAYTDYITIMGMEGDDTFEISQSGNTSIKLRIVGGYGHDAYLSDSDVKKRISIIEDESIEKELCKSCKANITDSKAIHVVDRSDFMLPFNYFLPSLEFNNNEGLFIGGVMNWFQPSYKSMMQHAFNFSHATRSNSYQFGYEFIIRNELTNTSFFGDLDFFGPKYVFNYFGTGNDTSFDEAKGEEFYFTTERRWRLRSGWIKNINPITDLRVGVSYDRRKIIDEDLFINLERAIDPSDLESQNYIGADMNYSIRNFDSSLRPANGLGLDVGIQYRYNIDDPNFTHLALVVDYQVYRDLSNDESLIYSFNLQGQHNIGTTRFYDNATIGGIKGVRGLFNNRFSGQSALAINNNLHIKVFDRVARKVLPSAVGITLAYDLGRVWASGESSSTLYTSYGFGIWISPLKTINLSLGSFFADETSQIRFRVGWLF